MIKALEDGDKKYYLAGGHKLSDSIKYDLEKIEQALQNSVATLAEAKKHETKIQIEKLSK
jgi:hypothetical protein